MKYSLWRPLTWNYRPKICLYMHNSMLLQHISMFWNEVPQFTSELSDELWTVVGNVLLGDSMVPPNVPVVQPGSSNSTEAGVALVEVGPLTKDVNHNHDRVEPMCFQKLDDEVHLDGVPVLVQNLSQMKLTMGKSPECLHLVARVTGSDILANVSGQLGPPIVPGDELQCLEVASVSSDPRVMVLLHNPAKEVLIPQHDNLAMKQEESV
jgi:hypothetical protein